MLVFVTGMGKKEAFVRFVVPAVNDEDSQTAIGVVLFAYRLAESAETPDAIRRELNASLEWFEASLPVPDRFNRTKSKGWYRRQTRGISWLRTAAIDHVARMNRLAETVRRCGYEVVELRTDRVGYVTYEDDVQVVAEPFRDTRTR